MRIRGPSSRRSSFHATVVGCVLVVAILLSLGVSIWVAYRQAVDEWRRQLSNLSLILAEQTSQEVTSAALVLDSVVEVINAANVRNANELREKMRGIETYNSMRDKMRALPQIDVASIIDAHGDVVNFTRTHPAPQINLFEREYFQEHLKNSGNGVFISAPLRNRGNQHWTFVLSRRLNGPRGEFIGVALVGLASSFFTDFYNKISLGDEAAIALYRRDFTLMARWPEADNLIGKINHLGSTYQIIEQLKLTDGVIITSSPRAAQGGLPVSRMGSARLLEKYPLIINATVTDDLYLAGWRQFALYMTIVAGASVGAIAIAFSMLVKALRRRERDIELAQRLRTEAEAASRAKSEFLAMMSHEIRTPLTSIIGFAELLGGASTPEVQQDAGNVILRNGRHLLSIINDILDISKIEAGRLQLERVPFSPLEVVTGIDSMMGSHAHSKGISFGISCEYPIPTLVMGDPTRWKQILFNLCSNAIKFTELGSVQLTLWYDRADSRLVCNVVDTGIGISEEQIAMLFKPFTQADSAISRRFGGSGLGLHLVQKLAERMEGKVSVVSQLGRGSVFEVGVAAALAPGAEWLSEAPALPPVAPAAGAGVAALRGRVLLAEDGPDNQKLLTAYFLRLGLDFEIVDNGAQAVEKALAGNFDLVLMDMQMPVMDGVTATGILRAAGFGAPIIAFTANVMAEDVQHYIASGCSHVVGKPIDFGLLTGVLAELLDPSLITQEPALTAEHLAEFAAIRKVFETSLPERIEQLRRAIDARHWDELGRLAHILKGSAGSFGYHAVTDCARELEKAALHGDMALALTIVQQMKQRAQPSAASHAAAS
jgi:signal transduction histidine kinase/CheY-like chemotaxis protein